eukprot:TRINITY_DN388_c0_g1_i4.p2 TRINITY_DN388_c0_g1~~TRINITY_DN388_c0_g1_i4.p2  ORF type:complete len:211 (-),score=34.55 TRINITY_DN388_c0_g1_i4:411-1043(-)
MVSLNFVVFLLLAIYVSYSSAAELKNGVSSNNTVMLLDFSAGLPSEPTFFSNNDDVMGGISTGTLAWDADQEAAVFYGRTLTDNNGGFSQVRSRQWSGFSNDGDGVKLVVKGDGRTYKLGLEVKGEYYTYEHDFESVAGEWIEVYLPFSDFMPSWRGFLIRNEPNLSTRPQDIVQLALYSSKFSMYGTAIPTFVPGEFQLFIKNIQVYQL